MGTSITSTAGTLYSWDGGIFSWDSAEAGKAWSDAAATAFTSVENETFALVPLYQKLPAVVEVEKMSLNDALQALAVTLRNEPLSLAETYIDLISFVLKVIESFAVTEKLSLNVIPQAHTGFLALNQTLALSETYTDLISFISQISEHLLLADKDGHQTIQALKEHVALADRILRFSNSVLSDLAFKSTPLDLTSFRQMIQEAKPLGFTAFKDLAPGDYEYARAIVRLAASTRHPKSRQHSRAVVSLPSPRSARSARQGSRSV